MVYPTEAEYAELIAELESARESAASWRGLAQSAIVRVVEMH